MKKKVLICMKKISIDFPFTTISSFAVILFPAKKKTRIKCHLGCFGFSSRRNLTSLSDNTTCHRMRMRIYVIEASANKKYILKPNKWKAFLRRSNTNRSALSHRSTIKLYLSVTQLSYVQTF